MELNTYNNQSEQEITIVDPMKSITPVMAIFAVPNLTYGNKKTVRNSRTHTTKF